MKSLTRKQIKDQFNAVSSDKEQPVAQIASFMTAFSELISGLQAEGHDVQFELHGTPDARCSELVHAGSSSSLLATGLLEIGNAQRLIAITQIEDYRAYVCISREDARTPVPADSQLAFDEIALDIYDDDDSDEMDEFQKKVISLVAAQNAIYGNDPFNAFKKPDTPQKIKKI